MGEEESEGGGGGGGGRGGRREGGKGAKYRERKSKIEEEEADSLEKGMRERKLTRMCVRNCQIVKTCHQHARCPLSPLMKKAVFIQYIHQDNAEKTSSYGFGNE